MRLPVGEVRLQVIDFGRPTGFRRLKHGGGVGPSLVLGLGFGLLAKVEPAKSNQLLPGSIGITGTREPGTGPLKFRPMLNGPSLGAPIWGSGEYMPLFELVVGDGGRTPEGVGGGTGAESR